MGLPVGKVALPSDYSLHAAERAAILVALDTFRGQPLASIAQRLGVTRYTLNRLVRVHGLEAEMYRSWPRSFTWIERSTNVEPRSKS